jgi:hypothetical protein
MTRHWTVSIDGGAPVHLDLAQHTAAIEHAKQEGKRDDRGELRQDNWGSRYERA